MGSQSDRFSSVSRSLRAAALFAAVLASASCGDSGPVVPEAGPGRATAALRPSFAKLPANAPSIPLSRIQAVLTGPNGEQITVEARFIDGVATLEFDVPITGQSATFQLQYTAFDLQGVIAFSATQTLTLRPGRNASVPAPTLVYDAPDAKVTAIRITPGALTLQAGSGGALSVSGTLANGQSLTPRVAWTSSNPSVVAVSESGELTAGRSQGTATITATSLGATPLTATAAIKVQAPVDKITISPASATVVRGQTANTTVDIRDATNAVIDDRTPVYTSADPTIATISSNGVITGVKVGRTTITVTTEGKTATLPVTIVSPVDRIELTSNSLAFNALKATSTLAPRLIPVTGASVAGIVPEFSSSNPGVASVDDRGVVTAVANGTARITISYEGVTASADVTVNQVAENIAISPRAASVSAIGDSRTFTTTVVDAGNTTITQPTVVWTSSDPTIATVSGTGATAVVTARRPGVVTITATANGKTDAVTFVVAPASQFLILSMTKSSIPTGETSVLSAQIADANGNPIGGTNATYTTSTPNVISISGNVITGLSAGTGRITGTSGNLSGTATITVTGQSGGGGNNGLTLTPDSVEKLPGGTQQFNVTGGAGTYTWTVNGIANGNSTYGTVTTAGFYTAPSTVPSPSKFQVCASQATPALSGCAIVVIQPIPTSGADVIVFNDVNSFDDGAASNPNNIKLFQNLVNYTGPGPRVSQRGVLQTCGHASRFCMPGAQFASTMVQGGYTITTDMGATLPIPIPANIKLLILALPTIPYSNAEINAMKQFSAEGGRILFIGEYDSFYGAEGLATENDFFVKMGAVMRNQGQAIDCGINTVPQSNLRPHQVTDGLTNLTMGCASVVVLGPNDYPLYVSLDGQYVLAAVAKVDVTPLPTGGPNLIPRANRRPTSETLDTDPLGWNRVKKVNRPQN